MKHKRKIPGIENIYGNNEVFFNSETGKILNEDLETILHKFINYSLYEWNNRCYLRDKQSFKLFEVLRHGFNELEYLGDFIYHLPENSYLLISKENNKKMIACYREGELIWSKVCPKFIKVLGSEFIVSTTKYQTTELEVTENKGGKLIKKFEANTGFTIGNILHLIDNILIVPQEKAVTTRKEVLITGIDLLTGEKVWEVNAGGISKYIKDKSSGKLYSLYSSRIERCINLQSVNVKNGELTSETIAKEIDSDIVPWNAIVNDNLLYYSDNISGCKLGLIDLTECEIVSMIPLELEKGVKLYEPHVTNKNIFIRDTMKTLHQFEY